MQSSKLGKVLKKMSTLDNIEREEEFKLKERCNALMDKWKEMLNKEGGDDAPGVAAAGGAGVVAGTDAPANGDAGDLTMQDASAADEKKTDAGVGGGVNAEGQTNGAAAEEEKKADAPAAETNGTA